MLLQILQLLIVSYIASHGEGKSMETRARSKYHSIIHHHQLRKEKDSAPSFMGSAQNIQKEEATSSVRGKTPEKNRFPKEKPQLKDKHGEQNSHNVNLPKMVGHGGTRSNRSSERKVDDSEKNYAEKSWNHFIYNMNAATETRNDPVKPQEVQKEVCETLPFTQNIIHKNCAKMVIKNNLCFGKCDSLYVPNQRYQLNMCSHCLPFKFTMNPLKLNCTGSMSVVKVIMMVEECKCVVYGQYSHRVNRIKNANLYGYH
ncbi:cerberus [Eleutherodactylus coqui]|uniref:cerberus n=1 Tax=Eleutherodactylus coqui TaxID=57060 RepID=UPI00346233B7